MTTSRRSRICGSKVKTGCVTCKKRRLKCDEQKPVCGRCSKSNRNCCYVAASSAKSTTHTTFVTQSSTCVYDSLAFRPGEGHREQRSLVYFRQRAGPSLGSPFNSDFFTEHLLLLAEHDTSVRSALVALGSMHEDMLNEEGTKTSEYTLQHYNKAIRGVVDLHAGSNVQAVEIALTTCILFACLESLMEHNRSCFSHWTAGLKVLQEHQSEPRARRSDIIPMDIFQALYARIDSQLIEISGSTTGTGVALFKDADMPMPKVFGTLKEAMLSLEAIYNQLERFLMRCERVSSTQGTTEQSLAPLYAARLRYQQGHSQWHNAFTSMPPPSSVLAAKSDTEPALLAVKLLNHVVTLMLSVDILDPELDFDFCLPVFQQIVVDSEAFLASQPLSEPKSTHSLPAKPSKRFTYTLSPGVVLPLYFTAARCRHSATRHRALALLRCCRRREGLWDSSQAADIAERIVLMEETSSVDNCSVRASDEIAVDDRGGWSGPMGSVETQSRVRTVRVDWIDGEGESRAAFSLQGPGLQGRVLAQDFEVDHQVGDKDGEQVRGRFEGMAFTELVRL